MTDSVFASRRDLEAIDRLMEPLEAAKELILGRLEVAFAELLEASSPNLVPRKCCRAARWFFSEFVDDPVCVVFETRCGSCGPTGSVRCRVNTLALDRKIAELDEEARR